jgi:hypothetical protein
LRGGERAASGWKPRKLLQSSVAAHIVTTN